MPDNSVKVTFKSTQSDDDAVSYITAIIDYYIKHFGAFVAVNEGYTVEKAISPNRYSEHKDYLIGDIVTLDGVTYKAISDCPNILRPKSGPKDDTHWKVVS